MLLNDLIKTGEDVFLIEGSFEGIEMNLKSLDYLNRLRCLPTGVIDSALSLQDAVGTALGTAYKNKHPDGDFWFLVPYPHVPVMRHRTEALVLEVSGSGAIGRQRTIKVDHEDFATSLREYLSISLVEGALCDCVKEKEPLIFARNDGRGLGISRLVKNAAKEAGKDPGTINALEICCGNGMSTPPLRKTFNNVLSIDNDRCAVCNGLFHGILDPGNTAVVDAMELDKYGFGKYGAVVGFMLGTIYEFNKPIWRRIFEEAIKRANDDGFLLFTVNNEEEMDFLAKSFASMGIRGRVVDNRQKGSIYDSWAFVAVL
ncbi:MAG TPA: class I SAM-dependent methyltransferase [Methanocella sp.]|nr:class I SAM-dependent methyltransferase [Methanocella sp.]